MITKLIDYKPASWHSSDDDTQKQAILHKLLHQHHVHYVASQIDITKNSYLFAPPLWFYIIRSLNHVFFLNLLTVYAYTDEI